MAFHQICLQWPGVGQNWMMPKQKLYLVRLCVFKLTLLMMLNIHNR